jgi:hypothetical protein
MPAVVDAVCSGSAQAGLLVQSSMLGPTPAECPQVALRTLPIRDGTFWFGIGASKKLRDAQRAANIIRDEIGKMAEDGSLASIDFRWKAARALDRSGPPRRKACLEEGKGATGSAALPRS